MQVITGPVLSTLSATVTGTGEQKLITLQNGRISIRLTNMGCSIMSVHMPGKNGKEDNIVAGFADPADYSINKDYFGCTVGRFANRIANGRFNLNGTTYTLPVNDGNNHLHGGISGLSHRLWTIDHLIENNHHCGAVLAYTSADGEEGYPGTLTVCVSFLLDTMDRLSIQYQATTTKATPVNLTNHTYFNLSGFQQPTILEHELWLNASRYTPKNEHNIPTGEITSVEGTALDFTRTKQIGTHITGLVKDRGYDHNFAIDEFNGALTKAAVLSDTSSGRVVTVYTDKPGIQVYTANSWDGSITGEQGITYVQHGAVALETQFFPDSPNQEQFPLCILQPGEIYSSETIFAFSLL